MFIFFFNYVLELGNCYLNCWWTTPIISSALFNENCCCTMKCLDTLWFGWNTITIIGTILKQYSAWIISPDTFFEMLKYRILYKKEETFWLNFNTKSDWNPKDSTSQCTPIKEQKTNLDDKYLKIYIYLIWLTNQY